MTCPRNQTSKTLPRNPVTPFRRKCRPNCGFAAQSLAELVGGDLRRAEQAMFESALELTRDATVLRYAPLLARRRARQRLREGRDPE